jgi:hypothetical protein
VTDTWSIEGQWLKNCNCDPGCPCDFNQAPTQDHCEGMVAMKIEKGHFGDVSLDGLHFAGTVWWPGRMDEGNGDVQPIVDEAADDEQRLALLTIMSGQAGGTFWEIVAAVCPNVKEPVYAPFEWEFDIDTRSARMRAGDYLETVTETLRGFDPPDPYRVVVTIPGGFEYTGPDSSAETAQATLIRARGGVELDLTDTHASLAWVKHEGEVPATAAA